MSANTYICDGQAPPCLHAARGSRHAARGSRHAGLAPKPAPLCPKTRLRAAQPQATKNQTVSMTGGGPLINTGRSPQNQQPKGSQTLSQKRRGATCRWPGQQPKTLGNLSVGAGTPRHGRAGKCDKIPRGDAGIPSTLWATQRGQGTAQVPPLGLPTHARAHSAPVQSSVMKCAVLPHPSQHS